MRNKHPNLNHYLFFKCEIFFSCCWRLTTPLTYPNSIHPEEPDQFPWHLYFYWLCQIPVNFQSNTQLSVWFCIFTVCLFSQGVKIWPPKRILNSSKAEAVMPPDGLTRCPKKSGILELFKEVFWVHYNTWLDYCYYVGQVAMAWLAEPFDNWIQGF